MILSAHFTLEEFTYSETAKKKGINNTPDAEMVTQLGITAYLMECVRVTLGDRIIFISSGYRCPQLNAAVGGVSDSQHVSGQAVDFACPDFGEPDGVFEVIKNSQVPYDQLIIEYGGGGSWVHISRPALGYKPRRQAFSMEA